MIKKVEIAHFTNSAGNSQKIEVYYESFGLKLGAAPVVLVNHSLTGNSRVTGEDGWWQELVGAGKCIDTERYTILSLNVPGNSAGGKEDLLVNYWEFTLGDIAEIFLQVLEKLKVNKLFAVIGGSIGGALAWEMAALKPDLAEYIIPIAADLKTTDWIRAQCRIQDQILHHSPNPVHDARLHAMTLYRTPQSFAAKFGRTKRAEKDLFEVESWLLYHGERLRERFPLSAYKLMNHLLTTIDISRGSGDFTRAVAKIQGSIHVIGIDSDLFFTAEENRRDIRQLSKSKDRLRYTEIVSPHGHDAFLIEFEQLQEMLIPIFKPENIQKDEEDTCYTVWNR